MALHLRVAACCRLLTEEVQVDAQFLWHIPCAIYLFIFTHTTWLVFVFVLGAYVHLNIACLSAQICLESGCLVLEQLTIGVLAGMWYAKCRCPSACWSTWRCVSLQVLAPLSFCL
jgi:hypothetical protein